MSKTDEKRATEALKTLLAPREQPVRELAAAIAAVEDSDARIHALIEQRETELLPMAELAFEEAKTSGWKARELSDAGLGVPRPFALVKPKRADKADAVDAPE